MEAAAITGKIVENKTLPVPIRGIICCTAFICAGIYSLILAGTFHNYGINKAQTNDFQLLIQNTAKFEEIRGLPAYVTLETGNPEEPYQTDWAQQDVFLAEAYGDYRCVQGGMNALLNELKTPASLREGYLLFTTQAYYQSAVLPALTEKKIPSQIINSQEGYVTICIE